MGTQANQHKVRVGPLKMGWCMIMFDLPVITLKERQTASQFRKSLLDDGYTMLQFSVYCRFCNNYERMKKHANRLKSFAPDGGNIRAFFITDKQWEQCIVIIGEEYQKKREVSKPVRQQVLEFW